MADWQTKGKEIVIVNDLLIVAETEKAYGFITLKAIKDNMNPVAVTNTKEIREKTDLFLMWMPKSAVKKIDLADSNIFPNLTRGFASKVNPDITLFKTKATISIEKWLAEKKELVASEGSDEQAPSNSGSKSDSW
jgi:hypothetical protein